MQATQVPDQGDAYLSNHGGVMLLSRFVVGMLSIGVMVPGTGVVRSQDYPNKPIRIVTGTAGGGSDFMARMVAQGISGPLGQSVVVDNRGAPILGAEFTSKAPPDGYTLFVSGDSVWILPLLQKVRYDVASDLSPITVLVREVNVLVVNPSMAVNSVTELIALAKAKPGKLNYGTGAGGTAQHIGMELFKSMAGVNIVHVPYKGTAPAVTALLSGEVHVAIIDPSLAMPHVTSGKLRALAVTSAQPSALVPGLPTVAASGLPGFEAIGMTAIWAPAKTPVAIIQRLNREILRMLDLPDVKEKLFNAGVEAFGNSPEEFAALIKSGTARWGKVIREAGIRFD
jgi:tripartite-type tricarboxylate transporter receptor subunit TctC